MKRYLVGLSVLIGLLAFDGFARAASPEQPLKRKNVAKVLRQVIENDLPTIGTADRDERLIPVYQLYKSRHYTPIWVTDLGPKTKAFDFLKILKASGAHGLDPSDYRIDEIEKRISSSYMKELMVLELLLSRALLEYSRDVHAGQVEPSKISSDLNVQPQWHAGDDLLNRISAAHKVGPVLASLQPQTPRYSRLIKILKEYREMAAAGDWVKLPKGETLKPGMKSQRIPILRKLMVQTGDLEAGKAIIPKDGDPQIYDLLLVGAVKRFQSRHGTEQDGIIGNQTLEQMRVPLSERVKQLELNIERRRWMQNDYGNFYVFVNLADQFLKVVKTVNGVEKTIHVSRLVVGKPFHKTPVFSKPMTYLVFNPYWNVPNSIATKEFLPQLRRNPSAMSRKQIRIFKGWNANAAEIDPLTVDWSKITKANFPYRLRQDSGKRNALGKIKFMFPNKFSVYIHDTPSKRLFAKSRRFFSHGCMRVQNPKALAELLLRETGSNWSRKAIDAVLATGKKRIVRLKSKIPVHITYLTAWVNKDMSVHFRKDIYGRDKLLDRAIRRSRLASAD